MAVYVDPTPPTARLGLAAAVVLGGYLGWAVALLALTWTDWWRDHGLARPAAIVDLAACVPIVMLTEASASTPFYAIFIFLILSVLRRFGGREAALTALTALALFTFSGIAAQEFGLSDVRWERLLLRRYYLAVLAILLVWFGLNQRELRGASREAREAELDRLTGAPEGHVTAVLAHARSRTGAARALLVWSDEDEPWTYVANQDGTGQVRHRLDPDDLTDLLPPALAGCVFLFDRDRDRLLVREPGGRLRRRRYNAALPAALIDRFGLDTGLAIAVRTDSVAGLLVLTGIDGMASDDLVIGEAVGEAVGIVFNRRAAIDTVTRDAAGRARLAMARDIHDSVLQLLAGTAFRLEAARRLLPEGSAALPPVADLQEELVRGQSELRDYIGTLREAPGDADASGAMHELAGRLERQWGIACDTRGVDAGLSLPARLLGEVRQLVREMVANAVRHGRARNIALRLARSGDKVELGVSDDGSGFAATAGPAAPRSLKERVASLGGQLALATGPGGSDIAVMLRVKD